MARRPDPARSEDPKPAKNTSRVSELFHVHQEHVSAKVFFALMLPFLVRALPTGVVPFDAKFILTQRASIQPIVYPFECRRLLHDVAPLLIDSGRGIVRLIRAAARITNVLRPWSAQAVFRAKDFRLVFAYDAVLGWPCGPT
jgi:hypothetical protein